MAEASQVSSSQAIAASTSAAGPSNQPMSNGSQSMRWSLQNFPVPVQLQARIPRSPMSVARELLPNFPSQLTHQAEVSQLPQQSYLSFQQQLQQQLQQQFQRQLQLNLQGRGESGAPVLPDPTDTILDIDDIQSRDRLGNNVGPGSNRQSSSPTSLLETILRSTQASNQRGRNNSSSIGLEPEGSSLTSRSHGSGSNQGLSSSHSQTHTHSHLHEQAHHRHSHTHNYMTTDSSIGGITSSSQSSGGVSVGNNPSGAAGGTDPQAGPGPGAGESDASPAQLSMLYSWALESGVFVLLLLLHFFYDHRLGILVFLCMGGTFYYTNMKLVHFIHQSAVRKQSISWLGLLNLAWLSGFLVVNIIILYYVFSEQELWKLLLFQMAAVPDVTVWSLLWLVVITDYVAKFFTITAKAVVAMMQPFCRNFRQRGKYYFLIESISQLYRQLITAVPWLYYLNDSTRTSVWFALITEGVYLIFKSLSLWKGSKLLYSAMLRLSSNSSFGTKPGPADMAERGSLCPICQDAFNEPVMLACKHIFCEQCVSIWFDRERTCPMCRAQITTESPLWRDGNTSAHLQWH